MKTEILYIHRNGDYYKDAGLRIWHHPTEHAAKFHWGGYGYAIDNMFHHTTKVATYYELGLSWCLQNQGLLDLNAN